MSSQGSCVGLDVHARSVRAAAIDAGSGLLLPVVTLPAQVDAVLAWLWSLPQPVQVVYEAGPTGYGLCRAVLAAGMSCTVAAPSLIPVVKGDRVKTDRRDAIKLARMLLVGQIPPVVVPTVSQEDARELVRAVEDARGDLMRFRHRLSKLCLRHGRVFEGPTWGAAHDQWLRRQRFEGPGLRSAFEDAYASVLAATQRRARLDTQLRAMAADSEFTATTRAVCCLRGIDVHTGFALSVEVGDWSRFTGNSIGAFLGLVPSEYSSGASRSQGGITKTGNALARRLTVEAAWHHKKPYRAGAALRARWDRAPAAVVAAADAANRRLNRRWEAFEARHKKRTIANVAIARELAGHAWKLATMLD